jgi:uncharacterized membrane protein
LERDVITVHVSRSIACTTRKLLALLHYMDKVGQRNSSVMFSLPVSDRLKRKKEWREGRIYVNNLSERAVLAPCNWSSN